MAVEVETPEDYAGTVMGDLSSRRGMVQGMDEIPVVAVRSLRQKYHCLKCLVTPHPCVLRHKVVQRTMEFKHYSEAPKNVIDAIVSAKSEVI